MALCRAPACTRAGSSILLQYIQRQRQARGERACGAARVRDATIGRPGSVSTPGRYTRRFSPPLFLPRPARPPARSPAMGDPPALKRPKLEKDDYESAYWPRPAASNASSASKPPQSSSSATATAATQEDEEDDIAEEAVLALIAHRERDVERCKLKLSHYQSLVPPLSPAILSDKCCDLDRFSWFPVRRRSWTPRRRSSPRRKIGSPGIEIASRLRRRPIGTPSRRCHRRRPRGTPSHRLHSTRRRSGRSLSSRGQTTGHPRAQSPCLG